MAYSSSLAEEENLSAPAAGGPDTQRTQFLRGPWVQILTIKDSTFRISGLKFEFRYFSGRFGKARHIAQIEEFFK